MLLQAIVEMAVFPWVAPIYIVHSWCAALHELEGWPVWWLEGIKD